MNKYLITIGFASLLILASCSDFLGEAPDNRTELDSPRKIAKLLVSGYSVGNYSLLTELSSDNMRDNNSPNKLGQRYNLKSYSRMDDEIFAWEPAVSGNQQDSPSAVWDGCYYAIAVANNALAAIKELEDEGRGSEVQALKGEALLIRAYHHFVLVNIFSQAYRNDQLSNDPTTAQGIPYVTEPETTVSVHYDRGTVTEVYNKIEEDLLEGLPLISDDAYSVPKYHFNKKAANAFAARFYLYKRKYDEVIKYANEVLGSDPSSLLRNWYKFADIASTEARTAEWSSAQNSNNLMLVATTSWFDRSIGGVRYGCSGDAADGSIQGSGPTWSGAPAWFYTAGLYYRENTEYGSFTPKVMEIFEYTDKVAGIGFGHIVRCEFTAEETLLCRAEAYVMKENYAAALADLRAWDLNQQKIPSNTNNRFTLLTDELIKKFYTEDRPLFVMKFHTSEMDPKFVVNSEQKPYLDCVLHYRRLETMFDGLRWFDLKRYGIEITHAIGKDVVKTLTWDDERRAIQIPQEVIAAGGEPSYRAEKSAGDAILITETKK